MEASDNNNFAPSSSAPDPQNINNRVSPFDIMRQASHNEEIVQSSEAEHLDSGE